MAYVQRDLRAADMLGLVLVGLGIALVAAGGIGLMARDRGISKGDGHVAADHPAAARARDGKKVTFVKVPWEVLPVIIGVTCLCLGGALNFKVRQLKRSGGKELGDYEGVPTSEDAG